MNAREEEQQRIDELKENFDIIARKIRMLCILDDVYVTKSNNVQVKLKIICEQPEYIENNKEEFDDNSANDFCYVRGNYFRNVFITNYGIDIVDKDPEEIKNIIRANLRDKMIIVKPDYFYNGEGWFYKNGRVFDIIEKKWRASKYFTVPVLRNVELLERIIKNEAVPLTNISKLIEGNIKYVYCNKQLYAVSMDYIQDSAITSDEEYNLWKRRENEKIEKIDMDYEEAIKNSDLIDDTDCDYIFVSRDAILKKKKYDIKELEIEQLKNENDAYDESRNESDDILQQFSKYIKQSNLCYTMDDIYNFYTCARTSQLVILAGMSGTGKTKLPIKFANFFGMTEENKELLFVPISPSFTEPSDVLGFLNPSTGIYNPSETRLVEFLKNAEENSEKMHIIIFDEMNLSQIEYWFAPFMSILEKNKDEKYLYLYSENQRCINSEKYPPKIKIGKNVLMIGTINLDETTKNISDRLLDRSYIINLKKKTFKDYYASNTNIDIKSEVKISNVNFCEFVPDSTDVEDNNYISRFNDRQLEFFDKIHEILNATDPQKGISFRSVKNISLYLGNRPLEFDEKKAFDYAFKQTIMKKINGSVESIGGFLGYYSNSEEKTIIDVFDEYSDISDFNESRNEIKNKIVELRKYGYTK